MAKGKWLLGVGALLVLALVLFLLREMSATVATPAASKRTEVAAAMPQPSEVTHAAVAPVAVAPAAAATEPPKDPSKPEKLDPRSEEFFYKFDELIPKVVTRNAAKCYEGRQGSLHRNQKLVVKYRVKVVNGEVTVKDVKVDESTIKDGALETCFLQAVQRSAWKDDSLPDVEIDDEVVLRPERGMKKYWQENIDYVGEEGPRYGTDRN